ncbi:MAG: anthranilate phosphoribosyltransferase [Actinobacteria bacterium]|nr:anthranilate phosphoribosyltransferase [Actinomycetota bacterium]
MIVDAIRQIVEGESLTRAQAGAVMEEILTGQATPAQFGAFVTALGLKGETVEEIAGLGETMRRHATRVDLNGLEAVDTCGTGGSGRGWFNVSTTAAFVAAGAGVPVAKHGNRGVTRPSGSADVLEALGVRIAVAPEVVAECVHMAGVGFMFAQAYHPAMRFAAPLRREIGIRTVFNILGPLSNPAGTRHHLLGVANPTLAPKMAAALGLIGCTRALVVHGHSGVDEISLTGPTEVIELDRGATTSYRLEPDRLGLPRDDASVLRGGAPAENAAITRGILAAEDRGPRRDVVVANAAGALMAAGRARDWTDGVAQAAAAIDSGAARESLRRLVEITNRGSAP